MMDQAQTQGETEMRSPTTIRIVYFLTWSAVALWLAAFTGCSTGGGKIVRFLEPPMEKVDVAAVARNLADGQGMLLDYSYYSVPPDTSVSIAEGINLDATTAVALYKSGRADQASAAIAGDPLAILGQAVMKPRDIGMILVIADSADIVAIRQSDNLARPKAGTAMFELAKNANVTGRFDIVLGPPPPDQVAPDPPAPDPPAPDPRPGPAGDSVALWKPVSESDGNWVALLNKDFPDGTWVDLTPAAAPTVRGRYTKRTNPDGPNGRPTYFGDVPGHAIPGPAVLDVGTPDGGLWSAAISNPGDRVERLVLIRVR